MTTVALAGATGDLGTRVAAALRREGAAVRALVRPGSGSGSGSARRARLEAMGCVVVPADLGPTNGGPTDGDPTGGGPTGGGPTDGGRPGDLARALAGADVVVSALSGVREVIVDAQARLLDAAVAAGVPRFMPSDFSVDFRGHAPGTNRNLDLRREFMERLDRAPVRATSVLNGMFTDLLDGRAPMVVRPIRRVVHWGSADQRLDFTAIDDAAAFAARAALDAKAPRWLRVAGESTTAAGVARSASRAYGRRFRPLRAGSAATLARLARLVRRLRPAEHETFPAWQGMQYFHSMAAGGADFGPVDNDRYGPRAWASVEDVLRRGAPGPPRG